MTTWEKFCELQRGNGPVNVCNNNDKESAGLLVNTSGSVASAISAVETELVSDADAYAFGDASHESLIQGTHSAEESGNLHGRIAREPIDRARYVVIKGSSGTMFACSRCSKRYIHRKSLNKHWNDKHADDITDRGKYLTCGTGSLSQPHSSQFSVALVHCVSDTRQLALGCSSSLTTSAVHAHAGCSPMYSVAPLASSHRRTCSDVRRNQTEQHSGTVTDSALWHSLAAIHLNHEHISNSFRCTPMPAHNGGHYNVRRNFLNQTFCDDDCQVLDLSKAGSYVHDMSNISVPDVPLDLSVKAEVGMCLTDSERSALLLHGFETASESAAGYCKEMSGADTLILNRRKRVNRTARFGGRMKSSKPVQSDSVAVLRHLHSGILTSATDQPIPAECGSSSAIGFVSDELTSDCTEVQPSAKHECHLNTIHCKNNTKVTAEFRDDLATTTETRDFFGGISRGGHIQCKVCDFCATSMLLFSRHVAQHVRKPNLVSGMHDGIQNQCNDGVYKLESEFFTMLGLYRADGAKSDQKLSDRCCCIEVDSLCTDEDSKSKCKAITDASELATPEEQANGFGSHLGESELQRNYNSHSLRQKLGRYQRGFGLTTTESRDAGRSWRRRRLRTCERCGYVTDNLTTLKRHEEKHGAVGMYRCKLCDYTVNQQHILEYHTRNVHGQPKKTGSTDLTVPLVDNVIDEHCDSNTASLVGDDSRRTLSIDSSEKVSVCDSAIQGDCGTFTFHSQVTDVDGIQCAVNRCNMHVSSKAVHHPASVTAARHCLLDAFCLQIGHGVCIRCGFRSLSSVRLKRHMLQHPHERHTCSQCSHTSPTAQLLLKHLRQHESRTGYLAQKKSYQCPECPFIAASPNRLQCHTQFHGVKFRHVCGKCSYSVNRANLIAQHRRLHVSALLAVPKRCWLHCSKCPFKTINRLALVNHSRGHYAVNCQYMCSLCNFGADIANVALGHQRLHSVNALSDQK